MTNSEAGGDVTRLLRALTHGDREAEQQLIPLVYEELRRLAGRHMKGEAPGHTLQATALVHEAYLRLVNAPDADWNDRGHFFAVASKVMRRILVDSARARSAEKRGGARPLPLESVGEPLTIADKDTERVLALDAALDRLATLDGRQSRIVELRYFAGMTIDETAAVLHVSSRTVKREWQLARAWLYGELAS